MGSMVCLKLDSVNLTCLHIIPVIQLHGCKNISLCIYIYIYTYKWISVYIYIYIHLSLQENILLKWSQENLCRYFKLILLDGRWRQTVYNINFLIGSHLTKSPVTLVSHERLFFCRYVPNKIKFWKWIFALTNIKGELKSNTLHILLGKSAVKHCFQ